MGEATAEVWTNLGLACFYAGQYDLTFSCFERALAQADDGLLPDIWYNIGQVCSSGVAWWCWRYYRAVEGSRGRTSAMCCVSHR